MIRYNGPIFLHPPKTAGSSIINALVQSKIAVFQSDDFDTFMQDPGEMHKTFEEFGYPAQSNYSISVRSPYTRYVSMYYQFYWNNKKNNLGESKDSNKSITDFKRYLMNALSRLPHLTSAPCTYWTKGITGKVNVIKFENLISDVSSIYNINLDSFPKLKRNGLGASTIVNEQESIQSILTFYDDSVISIINNIAHSDFIAFGYTKFDNYQEMIDYAQT